MTICTRVVVVATIASFMASSVNAALTFQFDQANYEVLPGERVDVLVSMVETGTSQLTTDGLGGYGVLLTYNIGPAPSDPALVASVSDVVSNPAFDQNSFPQQQVVLSPGVSVYAIDTNFAPPDPSGSNIPLATFTFTAGNVPGEVTNLLASVNPSEREIVNQLGLNRDPFMSPVDLSGQLASAAATITVIPEPSSLVLLTIAGLIMVGRRIRE